MSPTAEKVTIISVTYNSERHIRSFVESVQAQDYATCELLIIDNASKDDTRNILATQFPWVRVVALSENIGYRRANSLGFTLCHSPLMLVCNDDVVLETNCISELVNAMESNPDVAMTCPLILLFGQPGVVNTAGNTLSLTGFYSARGKGQRMEDYSQASELASVSGCCFLYRRDCYLELGGFSEDFDGFSPAWHASYEDVDLSVRVRSAGYKIILRPSAVLHHRYVQKPMSADRFSSMLFGRALLISRNFQLGTIARLFLLIVICEPAIALYALLKGYSFVRGYVSVWKWLLTNVRSIANMRGQIQSKRRVPDSCLITLLDTMVEVSPASDGNQFVTLGVKVMASLSSLYRRLVISHLIAALPDAEDEHSTVGV